jgi:hypothetical protein
MLRILRCYKSAIVPDQLDEYRYLLTEAIKSATQNSPHAPLPIVPGILTLSLSVLNTAHVSATFYEMNMYGINLFSAR